MTFDFQKRCKHKDHIVLVALSCYLPIPMLKCSFMYFLKLQYIFFISCTVKFLIFILGSELLASINRLIAGTLRSYLMLGPDSTILDLHPFTLKPNFDASKHRVLKALYVLFVDIDVFE